MQDALPWTRAPFPQRPAFQPKGRDMRVPPPKGSQDRGPLDDETWRDPRQKKICFTFQEPWAPGHRCAAGKAHYIEVFFDSDWEEDAYEEMEAGGSSVVQGGDHPPPPPLGAGGAAFAPTGGVLASLRGVPKYLTLRVWDTVQGQRVSVLVDRGATHNFIDAQLVEQRNIPTESFDGFPVLVPGARTMQCARYVPALALTTGTYTLTDHFFVVDIPDTNVILGVQWLITLGKVTTDWETLEMDWTDKKTRKHEMIWGMHTYLPQTVSAHRMEADFRKGDIEWAVELRVSEAGSTG